MVSKVQTEMLQKCPNCGNPLNEYVSRCSFCGAEIPSIHPDSGGAIGPRDGSRKGAKRDEERRGQGESPDTGFHGVLCPLCGSSRITFNLHFRTWRCNRCEGIFSTPNYSRGQDVRLDTSPSRATTSKLAGTDRSFREALHQQGATVVPSAPDEKNATALETCPECGRKALFWNERASRYECLNRECGAVVHSIEKTGMRIDQRPQGKSLSEEEHRAPTVEVSNTLLLAVKLFLADIRSWRRQYKEGQYICSDFTREVLDTATERGIRCGYVVISFRKSNVSHAIVAFETDYGLKFFEPQSGNEEDVLVGHRYSSQVEDTPKDSIISEIEITWNDGTTMIMD